MFPAKYVRAEEPIECFASITLELPEVLSEHRAKNRRLSE